MPIYCHWSVLGVLLVISFLANPAGPLCVRSNKTKINKRTNRNKQKNRQSQIFKLKNVLIRNKTGQFHWLQFLNSLLAKKLPWFIYFDRHISFFNDYSVLQMCCSNTGAAGLNHVMMESFIFLDN